LLPANSHLKSRGLSPRVLQLSSKTGPLPSSSKVMFTSIFRPRAVMENRIDSNMIINICQATLLITVKRKYIQLITDWFRLLLIRLCYYGSNNSFLFITKWDGIDGMIPVCIINLVNLHQHLVDWFGLDTKLLVTVHNKRDLTFRRKMVPLIEAFIIYWKNTKTVNAVLCF